MLFLRRRFQTLPGGADPAAQNAAQSKDGKFNALSEMSR